MRLAVTIKIQYVATILMVFVPGELKFVLKDQS